MLDAICGDILGSPYELTHHDPDQIPHLPNSLIGGKTNTILMPLFLTVLWTAKIMLSHIFCLFCGI